MKVTWHGHAFYEIDTANGLNVVVDPFTDNGLTEATADDLDPDVVLLTHGHFDHVGVAPKLDAPLLANFELSAYADQQGADDAIGMNTGGTYTHEGVDFLLTKAFHSSGAGEDGSRYAGNANGWIIDDGDVAFYHTGDTSLFGDLEDVVADVYRPDFAAVPIGDHFTMSPEHAAVAVDWMDVDGCTPMHYDTFPPIEQDPHRFAKLVDERCDATVEIPDVDESFEI